MPLRFLSIFFFPFVLTFCPKNACHAQHLEDLTIEENGLMYRVLQKGTGPKAREGMYALIHETTTLKNGRVITDTWQMNAPIRFLLGGNQVIAGLDEAVGAMSVGERRYLVVPPHLSRRTEYPDSFSPQDTLYYDVMLLKIEEQED